MEEMQTPQTPQAEAEQPTNVQSAPEEPALKGWRVLRHWLDTHKPVKVLVVLLCTLAMLGSLWAGLASWASYRMSNMGLYTKGIYPNSTGTAVAGEADRTVEVTKNILKDGKYLTEDGMPAELVEVLENVVKWSDISRPYTYTEYTRDYKDNGDTYIKQESKQGDVTMTVIQFKDKKSAQKYLELAENPTDATNGKPNYAEYCLGCYYLKVPLVTERMKEEPKDEDALSERTKYSMLSAKNPAISSLQDTEMNSLLYRALVAFDFNSGYVQMRESNQED